MLLCVQFSGMSASEGEKRTDRQILIMPKLQNVLINAGKFNAHCVKLARSKRNSSPFIPIDARNNKADNLPSGLNREGLRHRSSLPKTRLSGLTGFYGADFSATSRVYVE